MTGLSHRYTGERGDLRLFAAIDLDEIARRAAADTARDFAERLGRADAQQIRWVGEESLPFTLRFLGEVDDPGAVRRAVSSPFPVGVFTASLAEVRVFPYSGVPRVVWLGMGDGEDCMLALKAELDR
ncbi:MAG: 2'-5' RNA ligase family protein [Acidobacteriota bacterium]|nr:2'-5' RNA ligase family protein [Acidobacteriota bacterium]